MKQNDNNSIITVGITIIKDSAIKILEILQKITLTICGIAVLWWHKTEREGRYSMNVRDKYWKMLVHLRYGLDYYHEHLYFSVIFDRYFKMFIALFTASSVASWGIWDSYSKLWAILVGVGQVAVIINEFLPYKNRISQIQALKAVLNKQFQQAENKWLDVVKNFLTEDEINDLITECLQKWGEAEDKYIKDDCLPELAWLTKRAQNRMLRYFQFYYGGKKA